MDRLAIYVMGKFDLCTLLYLALDTSGIECFVLSSRYPKSNTQHMYNVCVAVQ